MFEAIGQWVQWFFILSCVLPLIVMVVLVLFAWFFGRKWVEDFIDPDLPKLKAKMQQIKAKNPDIDNDKLIEKIVHQQAFKCGIVGAITGLGGFVTLPITLPIDMLLTARYQATMVSFIANVHGFEESLENKAATYAVMTGSTELSKATTAVIRKYAPRVIGVSFSKLIPVVSAFISFVVNYVMARSTAKVASSWYKSNARDVVMARLAET